MPLDFPNGPATGDIFNGAGVSWRWDGTKWTSVLSTGGPFLPLTGGTVTGPVNVTGTVASGAATPATPPLFKTIWNVDNSDGLITTYQCQTDNQTYINAPVGQNIWANRNELFYRSPTPTNTRTSYIAAASHTVAFSDRGTATGAPELWAHLMELSDQTGHPSSVAGQALTLEVDLGCAGADDANKRQIIVAVGATYNYPTNPSSEITTGIAIVSGDPGAVFKNQLVLAGNFNRSGIDFTSSTSIGNAPAIWLATGQSIAFDSAKNLQFLWSAARSRYEFQWLGASHWSLNPAGDMTVFGTATVGGDLSVINDGSAPARSVYTSAHTWWSGAWNDSNFYIIDASPPTVRLTITPAGAITLTGAITLAGATGVAGNATVSGTLTATGITHCNGGLTFQGGDNSVGSIYTDANWGCLIRGRAGTTADIALSASTGAVKMHIAAAGIGFNGNTAFTKPTGYGAPTGTATRATFATSTVTLPVLAEHVKALIDDLTAYGLIGA
jgi:hypothetical protein